MSRLLKAIRRRWGTDAQVEPSRCGDAVVVVPPERLAEVAGFLRDDPESSMDVLLDLTAVDHPDRDPRFEVVVHLLSSEHRHRLRLKTRVGGEPPRIPSLTSLWSCADWLEREAWDMFGVVFEGHPDLRRILMYEEFQGHPLRKDYPIQRRQPRIGPGS